MKNCLRLRRLTDKQTDGLHNCYGRAIRRNTDKGKTMKQDIWAINSHKVFAHPEPHHQICPKGWIS
jgi:hypothetical protein